MKKLFLFLGLILTITLVPTSLAAVEYGGLGGKPANPRADNPRSESIFIYELEPGESFEDGVEVVNSTGERKTLTIGVVDSVVASDGSFACAQEAEPKTDVGSWVTLSRTEVTLDTNDSEVVDFTITAPQNASTGEHGGCITIQEAKPNQANAEGGVVLSFRSAIRIAVTIPGDIVKAITIGGVTLTANPSDQNLYTIQPSLTNTGNVSLDTEITARLVSVLGTTADANTATYPILPGSTARYNFDVDRPFWGGFYKAETTAKYNSNVEESLGETADETSITTTASSGYIFVAPSPLALIIEIGLLLALIVLITLLIRRLLHRATVKNKWTHHTVAEGDSLQKIAKKHGVSWKKLATANRIRAPYHLETGQVLKVPPHTKKDK